MALAAGVFNNYVNIKLCALVFVCVHLILYLLAPCKSEYGENMFDVVIKSKLAKTLLAVIGVPLLLCAAYIAYLLFSFHRPR
jgi:hypothetical protein